MKTLLMTLFALLISATTDGQSHYVNGTIIKVGNISFKVQLYQYTFGLFDVTDPTLKDFPLYYLDGTQFGEFDEFTPGTFAPHALATAFQHSFSLSELQVLADAGQKLTVSVIVGKSGEVLAVSFTSASSPEILAITPEQYGRLACNIKCYTKVNLSADDKRLKVATNVKTLYFAQLLQEIRELQSHSPFKPEPTEPDLFRPAPTEPDLFRPDDTNPEPGR